MKLQSDLLVPRRVDARAVRGRAEHAHHRGEHKRERGHRAVAAQAIEAHRACLSVFGKRPGDRLVAAGQGNGLDGDEGETADDRAELDDVCLDDGHVAADKHVRPKSAHGDQLAPGRVEAQDVQEVLRAAVDVIADPDDLDDEHHEAHQLAHARIAAVVVLRLLAHRDEVLAPDRHERRDEQKTERAAEAKDRAAPASLESIADRADRRTRADDRGAERAEDEKHVHVAAAREELLALALAAAAEEPDADDERHPREEPAEEERYVFGI